MCRISDTAHVPVRPAGHNRISDAAYVLVRSAGLLRRAHQRVGDTLMGRSLREASVVVNAGFSLGEA